MFTRKPAESRFPPIPTAHDAPSVADAKHAQREATRKFAEAALNGPEVRRVAHEMVRLRRNNGFGDLLTRSMTQR